jgi:hypothetical protein
MYEWKNFEGMGVGRHENSGGTAICALGFGATELNEGIEWNQEDEGVVTNNQKKTTCSFGDATIETSQIGSVAATWTCNYFQCLALDRKTIVEFLNSRPIVASFVQLSPNERNSVVAGKSVFPRNCLDFGFFGKSGSSIRWS